jgi:hypothetical protein
MMQNTIEGCAPFSGENEMDVDYQMTDDTLNELIVHSIEDLGLDGEVSFTAVREELKQHYDRDVLISPRDWASAVHDCVWVLSLTN